MSVSQQCQGRFPGQTRPRIDLGFSASGSLKNEFRGPFTGKRDPSKKLLVKFSKTWPKNASAEKINYRQLWGVEDWGWCRRVGEMPHHLFGNRVEKYFIL